MTPSAASLAPLDPARELLCYNGRLRTLEPGRPPATVLAARGPDLIYVGSDLRQARGLLSARARALDLEGRTVLPGLIDGHAHVFSEGQRLAEVSLLKKSREEILDIVSREARRRPAGAWIRGYGWNQENWAGHAWPTLEELDAAAPLNPVMLDRVDKHSTWVNSLTLAAAGIDQSTPSPPGGEILRDPRGRLQGILVGQAMLMAWAAIPPLNERGFREAFLRGQKEMLSFGLTSVMEAGLLVRNIGLLRQIHQNGDLKLRLRGMLLVGQRQDEEYLNAGGRLVRGLLDEHLSVDGIKIHSDGSLGSRSAWLLDDYADRPGHRGGRRFDDQELLKIMERARDFDLGLSIHAIGDAAVRQAVLGMEQVLTRRPFDHRWRIEHFQVAAREDLERVLRLGIVPSIQTVGLMGDLHMAEDRLGPERIGRSYAWRDILDRGGIVVNGADGPVESVNPFEGMYAAVSRRDLGGFPPGGWRPGQALSRLEALKSYTLWSAWSEFNEERKGSLRAGKLADFAVLDRDPLTCPEDEIKDIQVLLTVSGGEIVFERG